MMTRPSEYKPRRPEDFIGSARARCIELMRKIDRLKKENGFFKGMFYGEPGVGKSELAMCLAHYTTGHELAIEQLNGRAVTVDIVKEWDRSAPGSIFSPSTARIIDEWDTMSKDSQALLLTTLDRRRPRCFYFMTTNKPLSEFSERDQTRMQVYRFDRLPTEEVARWLVERWGAPEFEASRIAEANRGNVRGSLLDWESFLDRMEVEA